MVNFICRSDLNSSLIKFSSSDENSSMSVFHNPCKKVCHFIFRFKDEHPLHMEPAKRPGRNRDTCEPHCGKTYLLGLRPGQTQIGLYNHRKWLEVPNFGFRKKSDCTIYVVKTKMLISYTVTVPLICAFVLAYAKSRFSHDMAQLYNTYF